MCVVRSSFPQRAVHVVVALAMLLALGSPLAVAARGSGDGPAPVDLAALLPGGAAIEEAGVEGMATILFEVVDRAVPGGTNVDALWDAGLVSMYGTYWLDQSAAQAQVAGEAFSPETLLRFYAYQFADEDAAEQGWEINESGDEDLEDTGVELGDESEVGPVVEREVAGGAPVDGIDLSVRVGAFELGVWVLSGDDGPYRDQADAIEAAVDLLSPVVERVEDDDLPTGTLGLRTARFLPPDGRLVGGNTYVLVDGEESWVYPGETADERQSILDSYDDRQITSVYTSGAEIATTEFAGEPYGYLILIDSYEYETEDAAREGVGRLPDSLAGWGAGYEIEELTDVPEIGDASAAATAVDPDGPDYSSVMMWADGAVAYRIIIQLPSRLADPDALAALAEAQVTCLEEDTCWRYQKLPDEVLDDAGELTDAGSPGGTDATPDIEADDPATPAADSGDETAWSSDDGYIVSWDPDEWELRPDSTDQVTLRLGWDDPSRVVTIGVGADVPTDLADCVDFFADLAAGSPDYEGLQPAEDGAGEALTGDEGAYAWGGFDYAFDGEDRRAWVICTPLVDGESVIILFGIDSRVATEDLPGEFRDLAESIIRVGEAAGTAATPPATTVDGEFSYTDDDLGYTLSWNDATWEQEEDDVNLLRLAHRSGGLLFVNNEDADDYGDTPVTCASAVADGYLSLEGTDDVTELADADGEMLTGGDGDATWEAWTVSIEDTPFLLVGGCAVVDGTDTVVTFAYLSALSDADDASDDEVADVADVIESFRATD